MKILPVIGGACLWLCIGCKNNTNPPAASGETPAAKESTVMETTPVTLPDYVVMKNWEIGTPANSELVAKLYADWDAGKTDNLAGYFADSASFEFPDGRVTEIPATEVVKTFTKWRHGFISTSNVPFALVSLHNEESKQDWVTAWVWNKWTEKSGRRDSMLYVDNWRLIDGKVHNLYSAEHKSSHTLAQKVNTVLQDK